MAAFQMLTMMVVALLVLLSQDGLGNPLVDGGVSSLTEQSTAFSDIQTRIKGGEVAKLGQFPYVVKLTMRFIKHRIHKGGLCTGSIIAPDWILTAAHCLGDPYLYNKLNPYSDGRYSGADVNVQAVASDVLLGTDEFAKLNAQRNITEIVVHPHAVVYVSVDQVKGNLGIDMALLRVNIPFKEQQLALIKGPLPSDGTVTCQVVGCKRTLKYYNITVELLNKFTICRPYFVCSGVMQDQTERGDSGGPLVCSNGKKIALVGTLVGKAQLAPSLKNNLQLWTKVIEQNGEWISSVTSGASKFQSLSNYGF